VASYVEVETGKRSSDRPELAKALCAARKAKATLLIAKLDRLARNVAFIANLMDAGVEFLACDQPFASRLTLHILAAVAEDEAKLQRTPRRTGCQVRGGLRGGCRKRHRLRHRATQGARTDTQHLDGAVRLGSCRRVRGRPRTVDSEPVALTKGSL
jgi:DNA invertase Pin-like site-specific DNA recombinase